MSWKKVDRMRRKYYRKYTRLFSKALSDQIKPVLDFLDESKYLDSIDVMVPALINDLAIRELYKEMYAEIGVDFKNNIDQSIKSNHHDYQIKSEDIFAEEMRAYAEIIAGERITWITDTSKDIVLKELRLLLEQSYDEGLGIEEITSKIKKQLETKYNKIKRWRAKRIAQTETLTASNRASFRAAGDTGYPMSKIWLVAPGNINKTERHRLLSDIQDQRPKMDEDFIVDGVGMKHPGDPRGGASNVINCKCAVGYEVIRLN